MDRSTIELVLPDSKAKVYFYEFMVSGDFRRLQRALLSKIPIEVDQKDFKNSKIGDVSGGLAIDDQEEAAKVLIHKIIDESGKLVENVDDFLYNLSIDDGQLVFDKVREISDASRLSQAAKKK